MKYISKKEGVQGFFRGTSIAMCKNVWSATIFFTGLEKFNDIFK